MKTKSHHYVLLLSSIRVDYSFRIHGLGLIHSFLPSVGGCEATRRLTFLLAQRHGKVQ